jgi:hypothetical protein
MSHPLDEESQHSQATLRGLFARTAEPIRTHDSSGQCWRDSFETILRQLLTATILQPLRRSVDHVATVHHCGHPLRQHAGGADQFAQFRHRLLRCFSFKCLKSGPISSDFHGCVGWIAERRELDRDIRGLPVILTSPIKVSSLRAICAKKCIASAMTSRLSPM